MDYYDRPISRARGRLVASRQAFFEQVASPPPARGGADAGKNLTSLVDEKLERFTRSAQEATRNLAKSTPDLTALEEDANIRVSQHLSKSRGNLNQTFDSSLFQPQRNVNGGMAAVEVGDGSGPVSANKSFSSYFTHKKPPLPPKKPSSPPPPVPVKDHSKADKENREPPATNQSQSQNQTTATPGRTSGVGAKVSEFDRIVNSIKSTDTYRRYKNHPSLTQPPDMRRRSKSLGFLELDDDDNWVLPVSAKLPVEPVFPELSERSVSTTHLAKKSGGAGSVGAGGSSEDGGASGSTDEDDDVPIPCNRLTAAKSEYELRVEKSLKNLNLPDWYTKSSRPSSRASILSGRGTPAMSSERFTRNRPDYESFRSVHSTASTGGAGVPKREAPTSRMTTPSWRSFSSVRRSSPPTPNSEAEHESMEKTQNWINSQHSTISSSHQQQTSPPPPPPHQQQQQQQQSTFEQTTTRHNLSSRTSTTTSGSATAKNPPYAGWRSARDFGEPTRPFDTRRTKDFGSSDSTDYSSSFEEKRYGSERYSFVQAVNNTVLSEDQRSYLETSFDSTALPASEVRYHDKMWIETSLISRPVDGGFQKTDFHETTYKEESFPKDAYPDSFGVFEKREQRHPDVIYNNKEAPPRPTTRHPFSGGGGGGLLEAVV